MKNKTSQEKIESAQNSAELNNIAQSLNLAMQDCILAQGETSIRLFGMLGGKDYLEKDFLNESDLYSNYVYRHGEVDNYSIENVNRRLANILSVTLPSCMPFENTSGKTTYQGAEVSLGNLTVTANLQENKTIFKVDMPIKLILNNAEKELGEFAPVTYDVNLKKFSVFMDDFSNHLKNNPGIVDIYYLLLQNYSYDVAYTENNTYLFSIVDNESIINKKPVFYLFAAEVDK